MSRASDIVAGLAGGLTKLSAAGMNVFRAACSVCLHCVCSRLLCKQLPTCLHSLRLLSQQTGKTRASFECITGFRLLQVDRVVPIHFLPNDPLAAPKGHESEYYYADA